MNVRTEIRGAVTVVSLDRPERKNAVDRRTAGELLAAFREFDASEAARVLVLTGSGGTFCAGADLKALDNDVDAPEGPMGFTRLVSSKPCIAAVEGHCVAGGLELAVFCDLRVAGRSSLFGCLERRWGVPLIDGGTQRLPRIVGLGRALDLVLSGRLIDAVEAERIGLVNRVVDDGAALEAAVALGQELAAFPWSCLLVDRTSVYAAFDVPLSSGLEAEARRGREVLAEAAEGARSFAGGAGRHGSAR
ncbi:MAG: crotonase/enoyl-CoA hydratase family protein [Myxococcales bacterium]|nr:crotonase/enoyl-CoA hydratase family protein [Myxococcales bacterium]